VVSNRQVVAGWTIVAIERHFVTQRPSDPGIQRPGDPVDPVTQFYNELQMSTYVADKRLQWARGLLVFIAIWRLHVCTKIKFRPIDPVPCLADTHTGAVQCSVVWVSVLVSDGAV